MLCRCLNNDLLPYGFVKGQYYPWSWHGWDHKYVRVINNDFLMTEKVMSLDDFLHCFEVV